MTKQTINSWSFSSLTEFEKCPYAQYLKRIKRVPRPDLDIQSPLARGIKIHDEAEAFVKGTLPELPKTLKKFSTEFEALKSLHDTGAVQLETDWAFDTNWNPCDPKDWDTIWHISKADAVIQTDDTTFTIIDYKTGKSWGNEVKHTQQGQLYAVALMCIYPQAESITVEFWYLDEGKTKRRSYTRSKLIPAMSTFTKRGLTMTTTLDFPPKPNTMNCKWCDYGIANGNGKCQYAIDPTL